MNENLLPKENRLNRAKSIAFALRLFEITRPSNTSFSPEEFRKAISNDAFAINAFLEYESDSSDRVQAIELALQTTETYNRNFPGNTQGLATDGLFALARSILEFIRHEATPIA
jgi:hypothetical protein